MVVKVEDLGIVEYQRCYELQQHLFDARLASKKQHKEACVDFDDNHNAPSQGEQIDTIVGDAICVDPLADAGTILLVEHLPVYTLGKSGKSENLLLSHEALAHAGAQFFHTDRGGDITFHGPGQLVCYPILDLEVIGIGLRAYIEALEEAVIATVAHYGIMAGRMSGASGVWVEKEGCAPSKICAIGVRSSRYVTMHGLALNVSTDLGWFTRINPCGFRDRGVTSIEQQTGRKVAMDEVKRLVVYFLSKNLKLKNI